jgi:hypothetical protein
MNHQAAMNTPPALSTHLQPLFGGQLELCAGKRNLARFANAEMAEGAR